MTRSGRALALITALCLIVAARMPSAQSTPAVSKYFDTSQTITLKGRVAGVVLQYSEPTYLMLDVDLADGKTERWGVEGWSASELGWAPKTAPVNPGDAVTVIAYRARAGSNVAATLPPDHARLAEAAKAGRLAHGTEMTLPDGRKLAFGER